MTDPTQITLDDFAALSDEAVRAILEDANPTLQERFEAWLINNPGIYPLMKRLAFQMKAEGHTRGSINMIFEVARFYALTGQVKDVEEWKVNNSYRSRMARRLMEREPELAEFFETRELKTP